jgi:hypothetical protein
MLEVLTEAVADAPVTQPAPVADTPAETASAEQIPAESKPTEPDPALETKRALKGVQKRIDELTRARYEAEERGRQEAETARQETAYWRQQAEQLKQNIPAPKANDYQDYEQFLRDTAKFEAQKIAEERSTADRQQAWEYQQRQAQEAQRAQAVIQYQQMVQSKLSEAVKKYPDFVETVSSPELPGLQGTPAFNAILESDVGAEVMIALAKNPAKAHQIVALSPIAQVREIGRLEAQIQTGKTVSAAPPPPSSVDAKSGSATKAPERMTPDEYYRHITKGRKQ